MAQHTRWSGRRAIGVLNPDEMNHATTLQFDQGKTQGETSVRFHHRFGNLIRLIACIAQSFYARKSDLPLPSYKMSPWLRVLRFEIVDDQH